MCVCVCVCAHDPFNISVFSSFVQRDIYIECMHAYKCKSMCIYILE